MKSYTTLEQSKKLAKILPLDSADMYYAYDIIYAIPYKNGIGTEKPCWSLAALLDILHNKPKAIPSLSGGGYKDGKYISDWCLDYEFENGFYQKTFADNPVDACYKMIIKLHEQDLL